MRRTLLMAALLVAGCHNTVGPFAPRKPMRVDDPCVSIAEQERRGRDRLAIPEDDRNLAPRIYVDRPGPEGR
jgi:hypothetical protein